MNKLLAILLLSASVFCLGVANAPAAPYYATCLSFNCSDGVTGSDGKLTCTSFGIGRGSACFNIPYLCETVSSTTLCQARTVPGGSPCIMTITNCR